MSSDSQAYRMQSRSIISSRDAFTEEIQNVMQRYNSVNNSPDEQRRVKSLESSLLEVAHSIYNYSATFKTHVFGSRMNGLADRESDVDIYIEKDNAFCKSVSFDGQRTMLNLFCEEMKLRKNEFQDIQPITSAYVPILKFKHRKSSLNSDLSFKNGHSVANSKLVKTYLQLDRRVKFVICGVKLWMEKTELEFVAYARIWMVLFFLMQKHIAVVPTLEFLRSQMSPGKRTLMIEGIFCDCNCAFPDIADIKWESSCTLTDEELLREFFVFYSDVSLQNVVLSTLTGSKLDRADVLKEVGTKLTLHKPNSRRFQEVIRTAFRDHFCVQDPFDYCKNLTKNIRRHSTQFMKFVKLCEETADLYK